MTGSSDANRGDEHFEALYRGSYKEIFAYVLRHAGADTGAAADLVAEVFVVALRKQHAIPSPPEDRLWLYGVARRVVLDHQQRRKRLLRLHSRLQETAISEASPNDDLSRVRVREAIESLRPADREVLKLVAWDGLSHTEAAQILGCTPNAVALRLHKARSRLRRMLSPPAAPDNTPGPSQLVPFGSRSSHEH
jgi:RNA polymerase sigma-70 factor (ECF subfamily)